MNVIFESKLRKTFNKIIKEERRENLDYIETKAKGVVTKLTVHLTGSSADKVNRLVEAIENTRNQIDELTTVQKSLTDEAKGYSQTLFDEADKIYSRIVETNKATITFSKVVPKIDHKEDRDDKKAEKLINDILSLLIDQQDELSKSIVEMIKACDWIKKYDEVKIPAEKVTTKSVVQEGVVEFTKDLIRKIKSKVSATVKKIKTYIEDFDSIQKRIDTKIDTLSEMV